MPAASDIETFLRTDNSGFISPYSSFPPVSFYSSIPVKGVDSNSDCLPCSITNLTRTNINRLIKQISEPIKSGDQLNVSYYEQLPVTPPLA